MIDDDMETGTLGGYQERPRTFPNMRSKAYTPLVRPAAALCIARVMCLILFSISHVMFAEIADISYSAGYKCSCPVYDFVVGVRSYLLHGSEYVSDYCVCPHYLYTQLPCGNVSYEVGACER